MSISPPQGVWLAHGLVDACHRVGEILEPLADRVEHFPRLCLLLLRSSLLRSLPRFLLFREAATRPERETGADAHEGLTEGLDHDRDRRKAQHGADLSAEAARGDEDETTDSIAAVEQQHLGDTAAERMAHDVDQLEPDRHDPSCDDARVPLELVARVRSTGQAVSGEIAHQHASIPRQLGIDVLPRAVRVVQAMKEHDRRGALPAAELCPVQIDPIDTGVAVM